MSDPVVDPTPSTAEAPARRGQSVVEFALVFPMLIVLFLGIVDFGRAFATGITIEAAARNAAEVVAQEYLRNPPAPMSEPAPAANTPYYQALHELAARTACRETRSLGGTGYVADNPSTLANEESCSGLPIIRTCVHDLQDTLCGTVAYGESIPGTCTRTAAGMAPTMDGGSEQSRYVEVRICYRFTTVINLQDLELPFGWGLSIGDIWMEKDRVFGVGYYPPPPTPVPPTQPPPPPPTDAPSEAPSEAPSAPPSEDPSALPSQGASIPPSEPPPPSETPVPTSAPSEASQP
jgi:hypothetical protein